MLSMDEVEQRRNNVLSEMSDLRSMCPAALTEQMLAVPRKGKKEAVMRGPYYVLSRRVDGKTRSRRVRADELERVREEVANHKRFVTLCKEFEVLTEELGVLERDASDSEETVKKKRKSRSNKAKKSPA